MSADRGLVTTRRAAMGAEVEITSDATPTAIRTALAVVRRLEARWSRFLPGNELALLNAADGPAVARPSTARILEVALAGSRLTGGWFDPTRGADLRGAGYDRSLADGWSSPSAIADRHGGLHIDAKTGLVHIPAGAEIDLGGIAKGWAADVAAALLRRAGASYAGVAIGGDVRVCSETRVLVEVASPHDRSHRPALVALRDGGVAVSGPTKRRADDGRHHLIDPFTGRPSAHPRVAAVIAATAAGAEMIATAAAIAPLPDAVEIIRSLGATAWLVEPDGSVTTVGEPARYLIDPGWLEEPSHRQRSSREWTA